MLDLAGLPKNIHGIRTTHTCELCGFEPKTKNKYREKQDHLVMKHFKDKIDKIFPHCRPYSCPAQGCPFSGKDKQALLRHYTGKHGILERYLREALAEKGINYSPNENGKRRHSDANGGGKSAKNPRLSLTPPGSVILPQQTTILTSDNTSEMLSTAKPITLPTRGTTDELRKEVEAMMRSFQPVEQQPVVLQIPNSAISNVNGTPSAVVTAIPVIQSNVNGGTVVATAASTANVVPVASLPAIVLSAVANATAASVAANNASAGLNGLHNCITTTTNSIPITVSLPTQPSDVPTINVTSNVNGDAPVASVIIQNNGGRLPPMPLVTGPSANALPIPIENIISSIQVPISTSSNGGVTNVTNGQNGVVMSTTASSAPPPTLSSILSSGPGVGTPIILSSKTTSNNVAVPASVVTPPNSVSSNGGPTSPCNVVENEDVMWSAVNAVASLPSATNAGPPVVVEAVNSLPVVYAENVGDVVSFTAAGSIENIDYDYLYQVSNGEAQPRERQLDFCML